MASTDPELQQAKAEVERLRQHMQALFERTHYEDLEHAGLGLDIVVHALEETLEHTGLGGHSRGSPTRRPISRSCTGSHRFRDSAGRHRSF
jgi:hypothetical protein